MGTCPTTSFRQAFGRVSLTCTSCPASAGFCSLFSIFGHIIHPANPPPLTIFLITGTKFLIEGTKFLIEGTKFLIQGTKFLIEGTKFLIQGTKFLIEGTKFLIEGTKFLIQGTKFLIQGTKFLRARTKFLIAGIIFFFLFSLVSLQTSTKPAYPHQLSIASTIFAAV